MARYDSNLIRTLDHWKKMGGVHRDLDLFHIPVKELAQSIQQLADSHTQRLYEQCTQMLVQRVQQELEKQEKTGELQFLQLFNLEKDTYLLVHHYERCPDLTAYVQVINQNTRSPLYKKEVLHKGDQYYINFDGRKLRLDENKIKVNYF